jgi:NADPH:quinone reductase-like Zn-dependent oxidoreductase
MSEGLICRSVSLKSYGGVEQLTYLTRSVNTPEELVLEEDGILGPTQIIINVRACAVSDVDIQVREGHYKFLSQTDPIIGYEIAGVRNSQKSFSN